MAKKSMKNRELKRQQTVVKFAKKRAELKAIIANPNSTPEARWEAQVALQKQPRDASASRLRSRCGDCVEHQTVSSPVESSKLATQPRPSSGAAR